VKEKRHKLTGTNKNITKTSFEKTRKINLPLKLAAYNDVCDVAHWNDQMTMISFPNRTIPNLTDVIAHVTITDVFSHVTIPNLSSTG